MKKILLFLFIILISNVYALRLNEIEMNPLGQDAGNEWIEFYSDDEVNLDDYIIKNNDNDEIALNGSFSGYFVYRFEKQWLDNSDEKIFLYKGTELIDETNIFEDSKNNDLTWQKCEEEWIFINNTKNKENNCEEYLIEEETLTNNASEENNPITESEENLSQYAIIENETPNDNEELTNEKESEIIKTNEKEIQYSAKEETKTIILTPLTTSNKLNPKDIKSEIDKEQLNKNKLAIYGLITFCILLAFLFIFKKKNKEKNEFK